MNIVNNSYMYVLQLYAIKYLWNGDNKCLDAIGNPCGIAGGIKNVTKASESGFDITFDNSPLYPFCTFNIHVTASLTVNKSVLFNTSYTITFKNVFQLINNALQQQNDLKLQINNQGNIIITKNGKINHNLCTGTQKQTGKIPKGCELDSYGCTISQYSIKQMTKTMWTFIPNINNLSYTKNQFFIVLDKTIYQQERYVLVQNIFNYEQYQLTSTGDFKIVKAHDLLVNSINNLNCNAIGQGSLTWLQDPKTNTCVTAYLQWCSNNPVYGGSVPHVKIIKDPKTHKVTKTEITGEYIDSTCTLIPMVDPKNRQGSPCGNKCILGTLTGGAPIPSGTNCNPVKGNKIPKVCTEFTGNLSNYNMDFLRNMKGMKGSPLIGSFGALNPQSRAEMLKPQIVQCLSQNNSATSTSSNIITRTSWPFYYVCTQR